MTTDSSSPNGPWPADGPSPLAPAASTRVPYRVYGAGNAGVNIVEQMIATGLPASSCVVVNMDAASLASCPAATKISLESSLLRGLGTGGDPERGRAIARENSARLQEACEGVSVAFVIAGLGGGTGTGVAPELVRSAKAAGAMVIAFGILPFECEGSLRNQMALEGCHELRATADLLISLPNQNALAAIDASTSLVDTFKNTNRLIGDLVRASCRFLAAQGVMGLAFGELCALVRQRSAAMALATAEAAGPDRAAEVLSRILRHPMLGGAESLRDAQAVAVCIVAGSGLAMVEVNRLMDEIQKLCPGVPVMMGAGIVDDAAETLWAGLLVARLGAIPEEEELPSIAKNIIPHPRSSVSGKLEDHLLSAEPEARPKSRFVPPAPSMPQEKMEQLFARQTVPSKVRKSGGPKLRQGQLPLEIVSKGRFEKSEPTIHKGEDLDVPTYVRRGVVLN
jgi:cell division protein FtsZ